MADDGDEDPRLANTFMDPGAGDEGEEDPRLANTFMDPGAGGEAEEDLGNTFMDSGLGDEEDPRLANTFMPGEEDPAIAQTAGVMPLDVVNKDMRATRVDDIAARATANYGKKPNADETLDGSGPVYDDIAPDMTFMDDGGGADPDPGDTFANPSMDAQGADMTFMDSGGDDMDSQGADMTFMDAGGGGGGGMDGSAPDMTFMDAGLPAGMTADDEPQGGALDMPTMVEPQPGGGLDDAESDHTFVSLDSQEGMVSSPSLSGSRSQTQLRTQRFDNKVALTVEDEGLFAGKYKLLGELARGGMGVVYKALHVDLNQIVALKLMLAGSHASDDHRRRFLFEAEASARLKHANIVPVFDVGTVEDNLYFTMAFVKGAELKERKEELDRDKLLDVMIKVTDAISFAHQRGIIHRDLKPANVMMTEGDEPLVMDFGLAKQLDDEVEKEDEALEDSELAKTTEGAIMGTPYYMSPEQAQGMTHEIDTRTDTYALGVMLFQLWTKKLPFTARRATEILQKIVNEEPARPRQVDPSVPQDMEAIILKAMNKAPDDRYASAAALKEDLLRFKRGEPVSAQRATLGYRFKKWAQRNKQQLLAASAVFIVMLGSIVALGYQAYADRAHRADQITAAIAGAQTSLEGLQPTWKALETDFNAHLTSSTGDVSQRAGALEGLAARQSELTDQVRAAAQPLGPYVESDLRAGKVQGLADDLRRGLEAGRENLARMNRVHASLGEGDASLGSLQGKLPVALAALGSATRTGSVSFASLAEATKAGRELLAQAKDQDGEVSLGKVLDDQRAELQALRKQLQVKVYAGLSEAPADSPEAFHARKLLKEADEAIAKLDAERDRFSDHRLANQLFQTSQALQGLLVVKPVKEKKRRAKKSCVQCNLMLLKAKPKFASKAEVAAHVEKEHKLLIQLPPRTERPAIVAGANLSRDLIRRALQLAPTEELQAALLKSNQTYILSLLYMQAYKLFDVAIDEPGVLTNATKTNLIAAKARQLEARAYLRRRIYGTDGLSIGLVSGKVKVRGSGQTGAKMFGYMSAIKTLKDLAKDPLLDGELDEARLANLDKKQKGLEVLKVQYKKERDEKKAAKAEAKRKAAAAQAARDKAAKKAKAGTQDQAPE